MEGLRGRERASGGESERALAWRAAVAGGRTVLVLEAARMPVGSSMPPRSTRHCTTFSSCVHASVTACWISWSVQPSAAARLAAATSASPQSLPRISLSSAAKEVSAATLKSRHSGP